MPTVTVMPTPYQTLLDATGVSIPLGLVWTYTAGTTTAQTTYTDSTGTVANSNPIICDSAGRFVAFLPTGSSFKFVYENPATPPAHGSVIKTVDGITANPSTNANGELTGVFGQAVNAGQGVYLSDGSVGGTVAGHWYLWDNSTLATCLGVELGMAPNAVGSGSTGTVRLVGAMTGLTSLTPGAEYFVGTNGGLALASSYGSFRRHIGQADTTTSLVLDDPAGCFPATRVLNQAVNVTVTGTTAKTTVFSYTVPGNTLGTYRIVRATLTGYYSNVSVGSSLLTLDGSFGGVSFLSGAVFNYTNNTTGPFSLLLTISANASAASQNTYLSYSGPADAVAGGTGLVLARIVHAGSTAIVVNSAIDQALVFAVTNGQAGASFQVFSISIELLGQ